MGFGVCVGGCECVRVCVMCVLALKVTFMGYFGPKSNVFGPLCSPKMLFWGYFEATLSGCGICCVGVVGPTYYGK